MKRMRTVSVVVLVLFVLSTLDTQVWTDGMAQWAAAGTVPALSGLFGAPALPPQQK